MLEKHLQIVVVSKANQSYILKLVITEETVHFIYYCGAVFFPRIVTKEKGTFTKLFVFFS